MQFTKSFVSLYHEMVCKGFLLSLPFLLCFHWKSHLKGLRLDDVISGDGLPLKGESELLFSLAAGNGQTSVSWGSPWGSRAARLGGSLLITSIPVILHLYWLEKALMLLVNKMCWRSYPVAKSKPTLMESITKLIKFNNSRSSKTICLTNLWW